MLMLLNNRYQVIQTLGSGGFGETFLAEDTQMPSRRRCVIKQLKLKYLMKNGKVVSSSVNFSLLWDAENSGWVIADAK
jgi:serine/threonine protein kinase